MTPDEVPTRIGTLKFFDGMPDEETVTKAYDQLDLMRGTEAFLSWLPAASLEAMRRGMAIAVGEGCNKVLIFSELLDSSPLFLTGNTDTVYCSVMLDLERDGRTVIEVPPGCGPSTVNDAFFRFVVDMGFPGPDRGAGGKYLILLWGAAKRNRLSMVKNTGWLSHKASSRGSSVVACCHLTASQTKLWKCGSVSRLTHWHRRLQHRPWTSRIALRGS